MNNYKGRSTAVLVVLLLTITFFSCYAQSHPTTNKANQSGFANEFNADNNDKILLGCIIYSESPNGNLDYNDKAKFASIDTKFLELYNSSSNTADVIDNYLKKNRNIDFRSNKALIAIRWFIQNYDLVNDVIFAEVTSDDKVSEMEKVKNKIFKIPTLKQIYQSYLAGRSDMSSLSSGEGTALYIQIAYYLSRQTLIKRNAILKKLL